MENKKQLPLILGLIVTGLVVTGYTAVSVVPKVLVTMSKAAPATKVSLVSSYILGSKMVAKSDGVDACLINVFVLDSSGKGIKDKKVILEGLNDVRAVESRTNADGKMTFEITSKREGQFPMTALVEGVALPKQVTVTFRKGTI